MNRAEGIGLCDLIEHTPEASQAYSSLAFSLVRAN